MLASLTVAALPYGLNTMAWAGRPLDTEDTGTVSPGQAELELSVDYATSSTDKLGAFKGVLNAGLLPRLEARLESALLWLDPEGESARSGIGDSLFGVKYRLVEEGEALPAVLGSLTLKLPTGDETRGLGSPGVDVGLLAVVSKAFGPVTLMLNGGYTFVDDSVTQARDLDFWVAAGAIEYRATEAWALVGEIVGILGADKAPDTAVLRVGSVYAVTDWLKLDGAIGFGLTRDSPDVLVTVGATLALF
jgi:hypothetical protein